MDRGCQTTIRPHVKVSDSPSFQPSRSEFLQQSPGLPNLDHTPSNEPPSSPLSCSTGTQATESESKLRRIIRVFASDGVRAHREIVRDGPRPVCQSSPHSDQPHTTARPSKNRRSPPCPNRVCVKEDPVLQPTNLPCDMTLSCWAQHLACLPDLPPLDSRLHGPMMTRG